MTLRSFVVWPILGLLLYKAASLINLLDFSKAAHNLHPDSCRLVQGIDYGSEDLQTLPNGLAFISSGVKFAGFEKLEASKNVKGNIFLFDFNKAPDKATKLKIQAGNKFDHENFNPHGISLWQNSEKDDVVLFVVNHLLDEDVVEKFTFSNKTKTLTHIETIRSSTFRSLNDVTAVSADTFYVTNLFHYRSTFEFLLQLSWGSLSYYDGKEGRYVASGLLGPNGFARKGRYLYVAMMGAKSVYVYQIENDHSLSLIQTIWVGSGCDNVDVSVTTGDVWLGCHPVLHTLYFGGYMENPQQSTAPSQVLKIKTLDNGLLDDDISLVYSDNGKHFSASSVGVNFEKKMLIGSIYTKLLYCDL